ncbi:MAG: M1 family metallopeptidase [Promethearchaeota archaeon]|jgi:hypothetical protein
MKSKYKSLAGLFFILFSTSILLGLTISLNEICINKPYEKYDFTVEPITSNYEEYIKGNFSDYECSNYTLSVFLNENTSTVVGNLTADYYNDDPVNFTQIPFHLYPSGMQYNTRPGDIDIINVTTSEDPKQELDFEVLSDIQLMWVNLTSELEPGNRISFIISFNTTLTDGGIDRASDHGWDHNNSRIFKFGSAYPIPCVYDEYDGWNIDPYLPIGDPFYFDMAYYDLIINVPNNMTVAATGELTENITIGNRTINYYNPRLPVREVTFSASRYFEVESYFAADANVTVSLYYLDKSSWLWYNFAVDIVENAGSLCYGAFGNYTYPTLNIVQEYTMFGGMEYPCQVYISEAADRHSDPWWYLETIIAHEVAHQWFYNLVGVDEVDWGFLDEGIVCWFTDWYKDVYHPEWNIFSPYWGLSRLRHYSLDYGLPNKINQSIYECISSGSDYYYTAYTKAPTILEKLRSIIGLDNFIYGLRHFTHENFFEIAQLKDLQESFETISGKDLDWFFLPWFNNPYLPKYNFISVIYNTQSKIVNITIEDINDSLNPYNYSQQIPVTIYSSGSTLEFSEYKWINGTTSLIIPIQKKPVRIVLNYTDNVLVQFSNHDLNYLETTNIIVDNGQQPNIPSFNVIIILLTFSTFGIIFIAKKSKYQVNN